MKLIVLWGVIAMHWAQYDVISGPCFARRSLAACRLLLVSWGLASCLVGCRNDSTATPSSRTGPKTSYGQAVEKAHDLDAAQRARDESIKREADELVE